MAETVVQLRDVTKNYRRDAFELKVLQGITLDVEAGDYVALMGPSGSGKSTLLNLLAGIDQPTSGELIVAGQQVSRLGESKLALWRQRHIGFIFQFYNLIPVLTAYENVELPLTLRKSSRAARRKRVETALSVVGLQNRMKHYPRQLSGGQEQRVAIARAIVTDPDPAARRRADRRSGRGVRRRSARPARSVERAVQQDDPDGDPRSEGRGESQTPGAARQGPAGRVGAGRRNGSMIKLIRRNLLRNKRRTFLTMASLAMALFILSLLGVVNDAMSFADDSAMPDRLVVRNAISLTFPLPEAYEQRLRTIDNVVSVTPQNWFQGVYKDQRPENFFPRFTIDPATFRSVFYDLEWNEEEWEAFAAQRTAFAAGRELTEIQGWSLGDTITIKGDIYPIDVELQLRAIYDFDEPGQERQIFFHRRYVEEAMGNPGQNGTYWLLLDDPEAAPAVIAAAEAMFENSDNQVRAETAEAFAASFTEMLGNIRFFFSMIGLAIVISIFLITANTMAMAARERTTEVSVLRTLGFRRNQVLGMVIGESLAVGVLGAALGVGFTAVAIQGATPFLDQMGFGFGGFALDVQVLATAVAIGIAVGLLSGVFPAVAAARLKIVDGLRRL